MKYRQFRNIRMIWLLLLAATIAILAFLSAGCRKVNGVVYSEFRDIPRDGFKRDCPLGFDPWPADSMDSSFPLDLDLCVRYSSQKSMPVLRFRVVAEDMRGVIFQDTVSVRTFNDDAEPVGKGHYGVSELCVPVKKSIVLKPGFGIDVYSLNNELDTRGLLSVGVRLRESLD